MHGFKVSEQEVKVMDDEGERRAEGWKRGQSEGEKPDSLRISQMYKSLTSVRILYVDLI